MARASIRRILQLSVGRSRGEAVGRIKTLIGTPERFFYTGKPPTVLGGLYPLLVFIRPLLVLARGLAFTPKIVYSTPLGYLSRETCRKLPKVMKDKLPEISKEKQKLLSRIKRLAGQVTAVEHSVTDGDECADILMLLAAIRGGVNSLMAEILEDHIRLHITHPNTRAESPEELTEDLIALVRAYLK